MAMVNLEATACFDRIVRPIGALSLMTFGFTVEAARWLLKSLQEIQYFQIINNKVSTQHYCELEYDLHGYGQGLGLGERPIPSLSMNIAKQHTTQ